MQVKVKDRGQERICLRVGSSKTENIKCGFAAYCKRENNKASTKNRRQQI